MYKKLEISCNTKYKFFSKIYLNDKNKSELILSDKGAKKLFKDIKNYLGEDIVKVKNGKLIIDVYEVIELQLTPTDKEGIDNLELVSVFAQAEGYHVEFILELLEIK